MKVYDLQQKPIDLHINPRYSNGKCNAVGSFINDDGEVLDTAGYQNMYIYSLDFDFDGTKAPQSLTLSINQAVKASKLVDNKVNPNDLLGSVLIYNAAALQLNGASGYDVQVVDAAGTSVSVGTATYSLRNDQLIFAVEEGKDPVDMTKAASLKMVAKQ